MTCLFNVLAAVLFAGNAANPNACELSPIPLPVEFKSDMDRPLDFGQKTVVTVECPDASAATWLGDHLAAWYGAHAPKVVSGKSTGAPALRDGPEAYAIAADPSGVRIAARTIAGVRWAAYTIRQIVIVRRGTMKTAGYLLPTLTVSDAPHLAFRGLHLCWLPEIRPQQIERAIRLAAMFKFNHVVLEPWAVFRSEKHPWISWPDAKMTKAEVRRLVAIGKDLGVTLVPQFASLGHAPGTRAGSLKHPVLDLSPEYEPLYEPGGWNWCISNPHVPKLQQELMDELLEACGNPPYFHAGCDEAQPPSCSVCCATPYHEAVAAHLKRMHDHLKSRGVRMMMWHDMMLSAGDSRFKGFYCNGGPDADRILQTLPRDILICDWYYGGCWGCQETYDSYPTLDYFQRLGFDVVTCPWYNRPAAIAQSKWVRDHGQFGVLMTTWGRLGGKKYCAVWQHGPSDAWGTMDVGPVEYVFGEMDLATFWRQCGWDMGLSEDDSDTFGFVPATHPRQPESED